MYDPPHTMDTGDPEDIVQYEGPNDDGASAHENEAMRGLFQETDTGNDPASEITTDEKEAVENQQETARGDSDDEVSREDEQQETARGDSNDEDSRARATGDYSR